MGTLNVILCANGDGHVTDTNIFVDNMFSNIIIGRIIYGYPAIMTEPMFERAVPGISYFCTKFASIEESWLLPEIGQRAAEDDTFGTLNIFGDSKSYKDILDCDNIEVCAVAVPSKRNQLFSHRQWKISKILNLIPGKWDLLMLSRKDTVDLSEDMMSDEIDRMESWLNNETHEFTENDEKDMAALLEHLKQGQRKRPSSQANGMYGDADAQNQFPNDIDNIFKGGNDDAELNEWDEDIGYLDNDDMPESESSHEMDTEDAFDIPASAHVVKVLSETIDKTADRINEVADALDGLRTKLDKNDSNFKAVQDVVHDALRNNSEYVVQRMNEMHEVCDGLRTQVGNIVRDQTLLSRKMTKILVENRAPYIVNGITVALLVLSILINYL